MRYVLSLVFLGFCFTSYAEQVTANGPFFRDEKGAMILLRGVNVSGGMKTPPFTEKFKVSDFDPLPAMGVNSVRLVFIWEAFEPKKGEHDTAYLDWYVGLAEAAAKRGMRVVVDFHQDGFSRFDLNGCGCGAPEWAVSSTPSKPDNGPNCEKWGDMIILSTHFKKSFNDFYANWNGTRDHYLEMIKIVATRFKANPWVIGYDIMNEPFGSWDGQLLPLYTDAEKIIHKISPEKLLFLEPSLGRVSIVPGRKIDPMTKQPEFGGYAFAPHYYDLQMLAFGYVLIDNTAASFLEIQEYGKKWNVPVWIGEFSGPKLKADPKVNEASMRYVDKLYGAFNTHFMSSAQWTYTPTWNDKDLDGWNTENVSIVDDKGNLRNYRIRPGAVRISGTPTKMLEDITNKKFVMEWENDPATGETKLFAPEMSVAKSEPKELECTTDEDKLHIVCKSSVKGRHHVTLDGVSK